MKPPKNRANRPTEETFTEYANTFAIPVENAIILEHHRPNPDSAPYHFHPSIELNYLRDCTITYSFPGGDVQLPSGRIVLFWAAHPHRVIDVSGTGTITNAYVSLSEFLKWSLPTEFLEQLLSGAVLASEKASAFDDALTERWIDEREKADAQWHRAHSREIEGRLIRLCEEGYTKLFAPSNIGHGNAMGGAAIFQFEKMLRFMADNFAEPISVGDVASVGNLSPNYAISFFKRLMGKSIKSHVIDLRLAHAKMLLTETEQKIATVAMDSGFRSQAAFYTAFQKRVGISPAAYRAAGNRTETQL